MEKGTHVTLSASRLTSLSRSKAWLCAVSCLLPKYADAAASPAPPLTKMSPFLTILRNLDIFTWDAGHFNVPTLAFPYCAWVAWAVTTDISQMPSSSALQNVESSLWTRSSRRAHISHALVTTAPRTLGTISRNHWWRKHTSSENCPGGVSFFCRPSGAELHQ